MARHRNVRSLNADEEYENFLAYENEDFQDDFHDENTSSVRKISLSDFIKPLNFPELKSNDESESQGDLQKCNASISNSSVNDYDNENSFAGSSNAAKVVNFSSVKKKLIFHDALDVPTSNLKDLTIDDTHFKKAQEFYEARNVNSKPIINLAVIGHVDAGKSTLMGNMLVKLGFISSETKKFKRESHRLGKSSFDYAWVFDETDEERKRGVTIDVAQKQFDTPKNSIIILDTPGHGDFISKMISGTSEADAAILVIDASSGNFESGFHADGRTREHVILAKSLGISQLIVAINKMDIVQWKQERFQEIVSEVSSFLKKVGFENIQFVPCSGLLGINLIDTSCDSDLANWHKGLTLLDAINELQSPKRTLQKHFRLSTSNVFNVTNKTSSVSGRIQSGYVKINDRVIIMPEKNICMVSNIILNEMPVKYAFVGDTVELQLSSVDTSVLKVGSVICNIQNPIRVSSKLRARLIVFDIKIPITCGLSVTLQQQSLCEQAVIHKLLSLLCRNSGTVIKKKPRVISKNSWADVEIHVVNPMCFELYKDLKELGRFLLRVRNISIAAGMVTEIIP